MLFNLNFPQLDVRKIIGHRQLDRTKLCLLEECRLRKDWISSEKAKLKTHNPK